MESIVATYESAYKGLEPFALELEAEGQTDSPMYIDYLVYRQGYELARAELLESLGIGVK